MALKRVLLVNKFFYPRGGDCVVTINLMRLLQSKGHEVAVFSMDYAENMDSEWKAYFPESVDFSKGSKWKAFSRLFGGAGVRQKFVKMLEDFRPDVVHLHNVHSYLSPVMARIAWERGIPVFWTLHDYKLICPSYSCLLRGKPCEKCYSEKSHVLREKCMKGSLPASLLAYLEAKYWSRPKLEKWTTRFICPSSFMASKMRQGGFAEDKLQVLCNFVSGEYGKVRMQDETAKEEAYCYVGRLSPEKGIETLLKAASELPYTFYVAGTGPEEERLHALYRSPQIVWLGRLNAGEVRDLLQKVRFSVMPSECYENNPLSVIESLCMGTPVLGSNAGGIPELIRPKETGLVYRMGDEKELKDDIIYLFSHRLKNSDSIRQEALLRFSMDKHYEDLMKIYDGR